MINLSALGSWLPLFFYLFTNGFFILGPIWSRSVVKVLKNKCSMMFSIEGPAATRPCSRCPEWTWTRHWSTTRRRRRSYASEPTRWYARTRPGRRSRGLPSDRPGNSTIPGLWSYKSTSNKCELVALYPNGPQGHYERATNKKSWGEKKEHNGKMRVEHRENEIRTTQSSMEQSFRGLSILPNYVL